MKKPLALLLALLQSCSAHAIPIKTVNKDVEAAHSVPKIVFRAGVDDLSVSLFLTAYDAAMGLNPEAILVVIDTPGGSIPAGKIMAQVIEDSPVPVICIVEGEASSMGMYILQSCHQRLMTEQSSLMAHQPAVGGAQGTHEDMEALAQLLRSLETAMIHHLIARMDISFDYMQERIEGGRMWWFDGDEALDTKAVDAVCKDVHSVLASWRNYMRSPSASCRVD